MGITVLIGVQDLNLFSGKVSVMSCAQNSLPRPFWSVFCSHICLCVGNTSILAKKDWHCNRYLCTEKYLCISESA